MDQFLKRLIPLIAALTLAAACGADSDGTSSAETESETDDGAESIDTESDDTESDDTESDDAESDDAESDDAESDDAESDDTESDDAESDTASGGEVQTEGTIVHDDIEHYHEAFTPDGVDEPAPLVIDLHGFTGTVERQRAGSGFEQLAASEGFSVVWPQGHESSWNSGDPCCGVALAEDLDDVGYIRELVGVVAEEHPVDLDRVYVTGLSNGCAMAQRLAADASDLIAAVGCMALYLLDEPDAGYDPVPVMEIHGADDLVVSYEGNTAGAGAEDNFDNWAEINGCSGEPEVEEGDGFTTLRHGSCDGADVALVTVDEGGHSLYQGMETDVDTSRLAWDFIRQFRR